MKLYVQNMLDDDMKKPSAEDQKVAEAMMDELEALMKPGTVYVSLNYTNVL